MTASSGVRVLCKIPQEFKERWRLADEKAVGRQCVERADCSPLCLGRANDRTYRELSAEEWAWLRHDQVGLKVLAAKRRRIQVWKGHGYTGHGIHGSQGRRIARLVVPGLKMSCLGRANAEHDSQHFHVGHPLSQRRIEAVATLFDSRK